MIKPVFIFCLHRSGSTYLKNIIDSSCEVKMLEDETHFDHPLFYNTFRKLYKNYCNNQHTRYDFFLRRIAEKRLRGSFWKIYKKEYLNFNKSKKFIDNNCITVWKSFNSILEHILNESEKERIGIKYPAHFKYYDEFQKEYPDAKNIFLIRDPRAIVASKINSPTNYRLNTRGYLISKIVRFLLVLYLSVEYNYFIKKIMGNELIPFVVKYEDLILDKNKQLQRICSYCEIKINSKMFNADGKDSGYTTPTDESHRINRWTEVLSNIEVFIIDKITKKYRVEFGYE